LICTGFGEAVAVSVGRRGESANAYEGERKADGR
jgi:hypothetical protein